MIVGKVNMRYVAFVAVVAAVGGFLFMTRQSYRGR